MATSHHGMTTRGAHKQQHHSREKQTTIQSPIAVDEKERKHVRASFTLA